MLVADKPVGVHWRYRGAASSREGSVSPAGVFGVSDLEDDGDARGEDGPSLVGYAR